MLYDEAIQNWHMNFDKQRFQQVALNLLKNAIKFSQKWAENIEIKVTFPNEVLSANFI